MDYFLYRNNILFAEDVSLDVILKKVKTPVYIYSKKTILRHFNQIKKAFAEINPLICYSVKANSNIAILKILKKAGAGFDIVSGGELYRVLKIKSSPDKIVFAGVGKSPEEIEFALKSKIFMFNCESLPEIKLINQISKKLNKKTNIAVRINPDVEADTHKYITTGKKHTKFGISIDYLIKNLSFIKNLENINFIGIHFHIGSQITSVHPYIKAVKKTIKLIRDLRSYGFNIRYLNIGGGFGIIYKKERPPLPDELARRVIPAFKKHNLKLIMEPGRYIVGNAGILITKVLYIKETELKKFVIVDAGMNTLIRPTLYEAYHEILNLHFTKKKMKADVVGPVCETGDFFALNRSIPYFKQGDYLIIKSAGAYGMSMASRYNSRPLPAEVLVDNNKWKIIRKPENYRDLIRNERV